MESSNICHCAEQLAMASIPAQEWSEPYDLSTALCEGTIFPDLNLPFYKAKEGCCKPKPFSKQAFDKSAQHERETTMNQIMEISFAINDLTLYLDTHPTCQNGLTLFYQLLEQRLGLLADYAKNFNPLTQTSMVTGNCSHEDYGWGEGPLPWEGACI